MEIVPVPSSTQRIFGRMLLRPEILCRELVLDGRGAELGIGGQRNGAVKGTAEADCQQ